MSMPSRRQRRLIAQKLAKRPETPFEQVDLDTVPFVPPGMTRCFRNNRYTVMIFDNEKTTHGNATVALIEAHHAGPIAGHWKELQRIKNEVFGKDVWAVEYYPAADAVIDDKDIYWLWIFPKGVLPLSLTKRAGFS